MTEFPHTISDEELRNMPPASFPGKVEVVDDVYMLADVCNYLLSCPAIGFDTETRPAFKAGVVNKVALLQLSSHDRCFLFRLSKMRLDKSIIKVLESPSVVKVGAAIHDDLRVLQNLRKFKPGGFIDLQNFVPNWGIEEKSVRKISAVVLGEKVSKAQRLSNWEAAEYTPAQINYAATDAWVCLEIYEKLIHAERSKK